MAVIAAKQKKGNAHRQSVIRIFAPIVFLQLLILAFFIGRSETFIFQFQIFLITAPPLINLTTWLFNLKSRKSTPKNYYEIRENNLIQGLLAICIFFPLLAIIFSLVEWLIPLYSYNDSGEFYDLLWAYLLLLHLCCSYLCQRAVQPIKLKVDGGKLKITGKYSFLPFITIKIPSEKSFHLNLIEYESEITPILVNSRFKHFTKLVIYYKSGKKMNSLTLKDGDDRKEMIELYEEVRHYLIENNIEFNSAKELLKQQDEAAC